MVVVISVVVEHKAGNIDHERSGESLLYMYINCPRRLNLIMSLLRRISNWIFNKAFWTEDEDLWTMHVLDN